MESKVFLIDFDGTCLTHNFPSSGKEIGASFVLKELVNAGHKLILWTMRCNQVTPPQSTDPDIINHFGNHLDIALEWFKSHGIELYGINENPSQKTWTSSPKAYGHVCIDDTALGCPLLYHEDEDRPFVDWGEVLYMLEKRGLLERKHETHYKIQRDLSWMYIR